MEWTQGCYKHHTELIYASTGQIQEKRLNDYWTPWINGQLKALKNGLP